ncbi:hypothetical protein GTO91_17540 [Heliobacterium undosum]|uniref:Uncharacterized protein n=1 Tax=Heliomicrobium undosum TaxID=121734 RepID=A0A845L4A6_9FIRM|nr:hypothetical protein [Heliomicrobium undosum]MZP31487.1 hypothetical protein [Heliomicrobium undosum]
MFFNFLLRALGEDLQRSDGVWGSITDDIGCFDGECVEDKGIYLETIENLRRISKGFFSAQAINDFVDIEKGLAWVSFEYGGKFYKWDLEVNHDWFDVGVISKINMVLKQSNSPRKYAVALIDQIYFIGFFSPAQVNKLNNLTELGFEFL